MPPQERSNSKDMNSKMKVTRNSSSNNRYDMFSGGGGIVSEVGKSPVLSSKHDFKDDGGESFAVSVM